MIKCENVPSVKQAPASGLLVIRGWPENAKTSKNG